MYNISKDIVKEVLYNRDLTQVEALRLWTIARKHLSSRSGLFTLDELIQVLNFKFSDRGNVHRYKSKLRTLLFNSQLFIKIDNQTFKLKSPKKILIEIKGNSKTFLYTFSDCTILSRQSFLDFCIGIVLDDTETANKTVSDRTGLSIRRIQYATKRNHEKGLFLKTKRKVCEFFKDRDKAVLMSQHLRLEGIYNNVKTFIDSDGSYTSSVNIPITNKYKRNTFRRFYGKRQVKKSYAEPMPAYIPYWKPLFNKKNVNVKNRLEGKINAQAYCFTPDFNLDSFVSNHGL